MNVEPQIKNQAQYCCWVHCLAHFIYWHKNDFYKTLNAFSQQLNARHSLTTISHFYFGLPSNPDWLKCVRAAKSNQAQHHLLSKLQRGHFAPWLGGGIDWWTMRWISTCHSFVKESDTVGARRYWPLCRNRSNQCQKVNHAEIHIWFVSNLQN